MKKQNDEYVMFQQKKLVHRHVVTIKRSTEWQWRTVA